MKRHRCFHRPGQTITKSNEGVLLHNGILNADVRRQLYSGAWDELEAAGAAYRSISEQHKVGASSVHGPARFEAPIPSSFRSYEDEPHDRRL